MHLDLVVSGEGIHETEELMPRCSVDYEIFLPEGELSFGHALFKSVKSMQILHVQFLWGDAYISQPIQIMIFFDNIGVDKLQNFLVYHFQSLRGELSSLLANSLCTATQGSMPGTSFGDQANTS